MIPFDSFLFMTGRKWILSLLPEKRGRRSDVRQPLLQWVKSKDYLFDFGSLYIGLAT